MPNLNVEQSSVFARLLAPATLADVFARALEVQPLHVVRADPSYFASLFGRADLEAALHVAATVAGHGSMTKDGSLFVKDIGAFSPRIQALCNDIQRETLIYVQANACLMPANQPGFGLHDDTHDTVVLQIEGTKAWRVSRPGAEDESQTFVLRPGDTLYLPRGFPHACTAADQSSLHVTLALLPVRVVELAEAALRIAAVNDVELRRALTPGWQDADDGPVQLSVFLAERLRSAMTEVCVRAARELVVNELFATTRTSGEETLASAENLQGLHAETKIKIRSDAPFLLRERGSGVELVEAGRVTTLPATCASAINALLSGAMTVAAIEAMLPGSGIALVRLLVIDGLATILPA